MGQVLFYIFIISIQFLAAISNIDTFEGSKRFTICSGHMISSKHNQEYLSLQQRIQKNHKTYAQMNNYTYVHYNKHVDISRELEWLKIPILRNLVKERKNSEWILWIDSDALFIDMNRKIETILSEYSIPDKTSLVFSGDSNAINTGLLLIKNNKWISDSLKEIWEIGQTFANHPQVGMGFDNCAFAMYVAGCKANNTFEELKSCYLKADLGFVQPEFKNDILSANSSAYQKMLAPDIAAHVQPIPANAWNCYDQSSASFVVHFPGRPPGAKVRAIRDALNKVKNEPIPDMLN